MRKGDRSGDRSLSGTGGPGFAGIHLAGPNTQKTTLAILAGVPLVGPLKVVKLYEKIGAMGTLFSDERLVGILESHLPLGQVFVDCPLSLPPCVACARPSCPGAVRCDEVAVGYMLALTMRLRGKGARRTRPVNPQSQRVWDVMRMTREPTGREPSFSANQAPLVSRARILQRRLNAALPGLVLRETNVPEALHGCGAWLGIPEELISRYRDFEGGAAVRWSLARYLVDGGWLAVDEDDLLRQCCQTVESFHALMTAWVAALNWRGLTDRAPGEFADPEGWVFLPELAVPMATTDTSYSQ